MTIKIIKKNGKFFIKPVEEDEPQVEVTPIGWDTRSLDAYINGTKHDREKSDDPVDEAVDRLYPTYEAGIRYLKDGDSEDSRTI
jgi:hypothetical protein